MTPIELAELDSRLDAESALSLAAVSDTEALAHAASRLRDRGHGNVVSYSRKVFIPLTRLCRDVCHYCTFAKKPREVARPFLGREEILEIARAGEAAGCKEALFTLGDKPEARYRVAREALAELGHSSTLSYLREAAELVLTETSLLPHLNPGVMDAKDLAALRRVSVSQGIMLESASDRLCEKGGPHHGSPDKLPAVRLETIRLAGEAHIPFTSGLLIGIGETRRERIESLLAIRALDERYGHIQEIIVQNFRAKPRTPMAHAPEPSLDELRWTIAVARLVFGAEMSIQAPPNLSPGEMASLLSAGLNDWGGVSPVTPDHVNPEAPWPHLDHLAAETARNAAVLTERLALYPRYALDAKRWVDESLRPGVLRAMDSEGYARVGGWSAGVATLERDIAEDLRSLAVSEPAARGRGGIAALLEQAADGDGLDEEQIVRLFGARGRDFQLVCEAADRLRSKVNGDTVSYVVNRNVNYTNVCYFKCQFCAFSKGKLSEDLRGQPYDLDLEEIARRAVEAWERGATEICMQGGIHPDYTGQTYLDVCRTVKEAVPAMHVHAFSPLEVWQGAKTLGIGVPEYLLRLKGAGLGTLPGTAAEILDDEVRAVICPDKLVTEQWLGVLGAAHEAGFRTTATIMFGHVDRPVHWARHLMRIRALQARTGGITEFVPLPFVHMEAPLYRKGRARKGPSLREAILMHAVARLVLHPLIGNIQTSWVKMGTVGVELCLRAGANDLGGTLMNETITRAAGGAHGQEMSPASMEALIHSIGRSPRQRTTLYQDVAPERARASFEAAPLTEVKNRRARRYEIGRRSRELVRSAVDYGSNR